MARIYAHRGYSKVYPENTMVAFKKALEAGAAGIELDIHLTQDQEIIICHDERIDRTADGTGLIKDMTLADIQRYRFDRHMPMQDYSLAEVTAPTLDQCLKWVSTTPLVVNIEIKNNIFEYPGIVEKTLHLIDTYDLTNRVIISSFNHETILKVKALAPEQACGFLVVENLLDPGDYCQKYGVEYYHPYYLSLNEGQLINLKAHHIKTTVWTVDHDTDIQAMIEMGVDGVMTNDVPLAVKCLEKIKQAPK